MSNSKYYDGMTSGVVESGEIRGYKWEISVNRGNHPCAYVTIPYEHFIVESQVRDYYDVERECGMHVHGGLTYMRGNTIGWDYAHAGDFTYYAPSPNDHKWTHEEIMKDVERAIEELEQADKPFQMKRKVESLLREIGNMYIEQIERAKDDKNISVDHDSYNKKVHYSWCGGGCKVNEQGNVTINVDMTYIDKRGIELYKRDVKTALERDIEWHNGKLNQLEKQLEQL